MSEDIVDTLKCGRPEYNEETRNYETIITKNERLAIKEITRLREQNARMQEDISSTIKRMSKLDFERTAAELERDALCGENARLRADRSADSQKEMKALCKVLEEYWGEDK